MKREQAFIVKPQALISSCSPCTVRDENVYRTPRLELDKALGGGASGLAF
jgi:hypothetical protein